SFATGRTGATSEVQGEITSTLERLLIDHADKAALMAVTNWRNLPGGRQVLADDRSLERSSDEFRSKIAAEVRAWQDDILDLVRDRGAGKRTTARVLALGVNGVGVALMIVLFAQTGGVTGGEVAIGAGTAGLSQALLTAIFGEQAVRELASEARQLLLDRVAALLDADANRFRLRLWSIVSPPETTSDLREALTELQQVR
ncbi:MAG: ABC transporter, partial [Acidimicrobiales bacterium]